MEKLLIIGAGICNALLSILSVYYYCANHCDGMVLFFSLMFAVMAIWCYKIQKPLKFDFKIW